MLNYIAITTRKFCIRTYENTQNGSESKLITVVTFLKQKSGFGFSEKSCNLLDR